MFLTFCQVASQLIKGSYCSKDHTSVLAYSLNSICNSIGNFTWEHFDDGVWKPIKDVHRSRWMRDKYINTDEECFDYFFIEHTFASSDVRYVPIRRPKILCPVKGKSAVLTDEIVKDGLTFHPGCSGTIQRLITQDTKVDPDIIIAIPLTEHVSKTMLFFWPYKGLM